MTTLIGNAERTDWRPIREAGLMTHRQSTGGSISLSDATKFLKTPLVLAPLIFGLPVTAQSAHLTQVAGLGREATAHPSIISNVMEATGPTNYASQPSEGQRMCQELRQISGLTNEEIAPMLGVSRRSFQSWLSGGSISARKEARLRAIVDTVKQVATADRSTTRSRLLTREKYSVSVFDLLSEGRFDSALDLALGRRNSKSSTQANTAESLAIQFERDQSSIPRSDIKLNRRLSKPIRR